MLLARHLLDPLAHDGAREQERQRGADRRADDDDDRAADESEDRARAEGEDRGGDEGDDADRVDGDVDDVAERAEAAYVGLKGFQPVATGRKRKAMMIAARMSRATKIFFTTETQSTQRTTSVLSVSLW